MRAYLVVAAAALAVAVLRAAPVPPPGAPVKDRKQLRDDSQRFARKLLGVVAQVSRDYYRPVSRADLLDAALAGLYEAAGRHAPADLRAQVRQTVGLSELLHAGGGEPDPSPLHVPAPPPASNDPLERYLARTRESLGTPPGLTGADDALLACCKAMARRLDPHSGVVTREEQFQALGLEYETLGPGMELRGGPGGGAFVVASVQLGGPAQRAGLRPGDTITHVGGRPAAKAAPELLRALRNERVLAEAPLLTPEGAPGEDARPGPPPFVEVRYRRAGETRERSATLLRERFRPETVLGVRRREDNTWNYVLDAKHRIAQVRLTSLSKGASDELRGVLLELRRRKVKGLILDLRWCPGGMLDEAVSAADLFLGNALIATTRSRGREDVPYRSTDLNKFHDFRVAVLVNEETSGGAELIAAALQDNKAAVVVGQRTRGKGSIQTAFLLGVGDVRFKLTSGTLHRPNGKGLNRPPATAPCLPQATADAWGVVPDEDCRVSPALGQRLKGWWRAYSMRPPTSDERLPLDDPRADPQQLAAAALLRDQLGR
jgi:C-terminal processing protease CtpA/Prc